MELSLKSQCLKRNLESKEVLSMVTETKKDWEEVVVDDQVWRPEAVDDEIIGFYICKEVNVGPYNSKRYAIKNEEGEFFVYGSTGLDNKMAEVSTGDEVRIVYKGEKPSVPPKKPFKVFKVFKRKHNSEPEEPENEAPSMNLEDDVEARGWIEQLTNQLLEDKIQIDNKGKALKVLAKKWSQDEDMGLTEEMLERINKQIDRRG